jgi:hypothetical protein
MTRKMPRLDFSQAPEADARRRDVEAKDRVEALLPGPDGAAARFRQQHGLLGDFVINELLLGNDLGSVLAGLGPNFALAIISATMNASVEFPDQLAMSFLETLADDLHSAFHRLRSSGMNRLEGNVTIDTRTGQVTDFDFRERLKRPPCA